MSYDRTHFRALFHQECDRCLDGLDGAMDGLDPHEPSTEALVVAHRMVHTISGGAALVGFEDVAELSKTLERVLGALLHRSVGATPEALGALDDGRAVLRRLVDARRDGRAVDQAVVDRAARRLRAILGDEGSAASAV